MAVVHSASAGVYQCKSADGKVSFQQNPCPEPDGRTDPIQTAFLNDTIAQKSFERLVRASHSNRVDGVQALVTERFKLTTAPVSQPDALDRELGLAEIRAVAAVIKRYVPKDPFAASEFSAVRDRGAIIVTMKPSNRTSYQQLSAAIVLKGNVAQVEWVKLITEEP